VTNTLAYHRREIDLSCSVVDIWQKNKRFCFCLVNNFTTLIVKGREEGEGVKQQQTLPDRKLLGRNWGWDRRIPEPWGLCYRP